MGYISYGLESLLFVVLLLGLSYVLLDLLPVVWKRMRHAFVSAPIGFGGSFILVLIGLLLL